MEHFDVIVIGAGLSGMSAAYKVKNDLKKSLCVLEGNENSSVLTICNLIILFCQLVTLSEELGTCSATLASALTATCSLWVTPSLPGWMKRHSLMVVKF